jgi:hypothetical protein
MGYLGYKPADKPLTAADITDSIITSAKITDATIVNGDIANSTIALAKLSATGTASASTFLRGDNSWGEAGAAAGQVIQVVTATDQTERTTTSTGFATASNTLSVTITPSSASNKIFVVTSGIVNNEGNSSGYATIYRGATNLGNSSFGMLKARGGDLGILNALCMSKLDSPSTTSATTYQVYIRTSVSADMTLNKDGCQSSITCFEIKG